MAWDKDSDAYKVHKRKAAQRNADMSREEREIGLPPAIANPERRASCEGRGGLKRFCEIYRAEVFNLEWSNDHLIVIAQLEATILEGGIYALAMPRGSGKTSLVVTAALWAILYGYRSFVVLIGATATAANGMLDTIKSEIETNELLLEDFPAACYPIRQLEGINQRCAGQTINGERTRIRWKFSHLVFPTVSGSPSSAATVRVAGITGAIRGLQSQGPDGGTIRPDLALPDDPQTDKSAKSLIDTAKRERILKGAVMGLAGPGKKIAVCMPCTVIAQDDLADRLLDRQRSPDWMGLKLKLLAEMPANLELWNQYRDIRADSLRDLGNISRATEFYQSNREEMDRGSHPSWPARFEPDQVSAVQYAMDLWAKDEAAFWAEYQNEPRRQEVGGAGALSAAEVAARITGHKRGSIPEWAEFVTVGMDVQQDVLFWIAVAWSKSMRGSIIDFAAWPEQHKPYWTLGDVRDTLRTKYRAATVTEGLIKGLGELCRDLLGRTWASSRHELRASLLTCDMNWAPSTNVVFDVAREIGPTMLPYGGRYIGASSLPMDKWKKEPGDREGTDWRVISGKRKQRHILADINAWKSRVSDWLRTDSELEGLWLPGSSPNDNRLLADHLASEYPIAVEGRGRRLDEWKQRPGRDNHWFDCLVQAAVGASIVGGRVHGELKPIQRKRVNWAEEAKRRRSG